MHPATLLVVEDQPLLAEFMTVVAEDAGWTATSATTADQFEREMEQHHPDAIALDLAMPDRDGIELLRYLVKQGFDGKLMIVSGCDAPVIEASGVLARHHGLKMVGCYQKPLTAQAFTAILERI